MLFYHRGKGSPGELSRNVFHRFLGVVPDFQETKLFMALKSIQ